MNPVKRVTTKISVEHLLFLFDTFPMFLSANNKRKARYYKTKLKKLLNNETVK